MLPKILEWVLERPAIIVVVLVFAGQIIRGLMNARKASTEHESRRDDLAEERRVREVQENVRRQIAERRGKVPPVVEADPVRREMEIPPVARPQTTQLPEPFGGPLGRMLEELQKRAQPAPAAPPVLVEHVNRAELERQQALAEQLRSLEESRVLVQRRATNLATENMATAQAEPRQRSAARGRLLEDLSEAHSLRRAFVLREVLGPPVGLR